MNQLNSIAHHDVIGLTYILTYHTHTTYTYKNESNISQVVQPR